MVGYHGRFVWYELMTPDVKAARAFYAKVMGWSAQDVSIPGTPYTLFAAGKATVSGLMHLSEDARKMGAAPRWIGYVGVNDVDASAERAKRLGGAVRIPPTDAPNVSRFALITDPQTAPLGLLKWMIPGQGQPAEAGAQSPVGWHELLAADWEQAWAFYGELFGWQKALAETGPTGVYQLFSAAGQKIGGMRNKPPTAPDPYWLYYFSVGDIDAAAKRVEAVHGQIFDGPVEVPGGSWIVHCTDPQGANFALIGKRSRNRIGYFERVASPGRRGG